jgi:hypothetical protein
VIDPFGQDVLEAELDEARAEARALAEAQLVQRRAFRARGGACAGATRRERGLPRHERREHLGTACAPARSRRRRVEPVTRRPAAAIEQPTAGARAPLAVRDLNRNDQSAERIASKDTQLARAAGQRACKDHEIPAGGAALHPQLPHLVCERERLPVAVDT